MSWVLPKSVTVREVGPRDGFQNERQFIPTDQKVAIINALLETGVRRLEVTSFVHPKWIPQLADAEEVLQRINKVPEVSYVVLVPNRRGLQRAIDARAAGAKIDEVAFVMSASEGHNRANVNMAVAESLAEVGEGIRAAKAAGFRAGAGLSCSFGCPFDGHVPVEKVIELAKELWHQGADQVGLSDTIGCANPVAVHEMFSRAKREIPGIEINVHFHNTRGQGAANTLAALLEGVTSMDTAFGELGGCPYAPGATGNIATEDVVALLHEMGIATGIDVEKMIACARMAQEAVGRELTSHVLKAGPVNWEGRGKSGGTASPS